MTNLERKRLLILGAGRGQVGLYKAAKEMGIHTIAGTMPDNNPPCIPLADEVCFMNILDPNEVAQKTSDLQFDGVATCCLDKGLKALGRLCDERNLNGFSEDSANVCNDKLLMKQKFIEHGVNTAPYVYVSDEHQLKDAVNKLNGYPLIIKATDLAGSRGIYIVRNEEETLDGFRKAIDLTKKKYLIVEKFIEGNEFGAQAFIQNGKIFFVLPHGDLLFHGSTNVPIGHYAPFEVSTSLLNDIEEEAKKAISAVGLDNCAVNIDFIEKDGKVYVLELSGRIGANGLPEVVSGYYHINYYKMVILAALGIPVDSLWESRKESGAVMSRMVISKEKSGTLNKIYYDGPIPNDVFDMEFFVKPNCEVTKFDNTTHCLGQFVISEDTIKDCFSRSAEIFDKIIIDIPEYSVDSVNNLTKK